MSSPRPTSRACSRPLSSASGFTIIEVVIAVLLLAIIASGMAIAMAGSSHSLNAAKVASRKAAVAGRIADVIRNERGWVDTCRQAGGTTCNLAGGGYAATAASIKGKLTDGSLGKACGSGGDFTFQLDKAEVKKVDSAVDGVGTADKDHRTPDYYTITVLVSIPNCDTVRLAAAAGGSTVDATPYLYQTSIDETGRKLTGGLTVQACTVKNQVDERMSLEGCSATGTTSIQMGVCPPAISPSNPEVNCPTALAWAHRAVSPNDPNVRSDWMDLQRASTSFSLVGPSGSVSSGSARHTSSGWEFDNLTAGSYRVVSIGVPGGKELWQTKMIPAANGPTGGYLTVAPDVTSRALIMFRPKRTGHLDMTFHRIVRHYKAEQRTGSMEKDGIDTDEFVGSEFVVIKEVTNLISLIHHTGETGEHVTTKPDPHCGGGEWICTKGNCVYDTVETKIDSVDPTPAVPADPANNLPEIPAYPGFAGSDDVAHEQTCSKYDLTAKYTYYVPVLLSTDWNVPGAVADGSYAISPAPTYRELATAAEETVANGSCGAVSAPTLVELISAACVKSHASSTASLRSIATGLNTPVRSSNTLTTTYQKYDSSGHKWDTYGNDRSADANDNYSHVLPKVTGVPGIWVNQAGALSTGGGTLALKGWGECLWGGVEGPCGNCNILLPGKGSFATCDLLVKVESKRCGYYVGTYADKFPARDCKPENKDVLEVCSGAPAAGDEKKLAPNCSPVPPATPNCSGCGTGTPGALTRAVYSALPSEPASAGIGIGTG